MRPLLIVVSAPSGAGKSTLCDRLLADRSDIVYSISCTTRHPRGDEVDGKDYFFLTEQQFEGKVSAGEFLEHALVHGNRYGTLRKMVDDAMGAGRSVIMDIDVQGAAQIRSYAAKLPDGDLLRKGYIDIFIAPPSMQALKERLEKRAEDAPGEIARRLKNAGVEMKRRNEYRYVVVNDSLDRAYAELKEILRNEAEK